MDDGALTGPGLASAGAPQHLAAGPAIGTPRPRRRRRDAEQPARLVEAAQHAHELLGENAPLRVRQGLREALAALRALDQQRRQIRYHPLRAGLERRMSQFGKAVRRTDYEPMQVERGGMQHHGERIVAEPRQKRAQITIL